MVTTQEYERALEQVGAWPPEVRLHFAQDVLRSLFPVVREAAGGVAQASEPSSPPADDDLLLHMHRMEKHG
jgi:hypothetical protein